MKELGLEREAFYKLVDRVRSISLINWDEITGREKLDGTTGEVASDFWKGTDPFRDLNIRRVRQVLQNAIEVLPEKERIVVSLYYYADLNMKEIGEVLDITESRISQIHTKAVLRLRGKILTSFS
jgi:RNA polymerase sigma factor for flagellar operon FliA